MCCLYILDNSSYAWSALGFGIVMKMGTRLLCLEALGMGNTPFHKAWGVLVEAVCLCVCGDDHMGSFRTQLIQV